MTRRTVLSLLAVGPLRSRRVHILSGPLNGMSGTATAFENDRVAVTVRLIGRPISVWLSRDCVQFRV
jgi:hypothetical protein